jgi:hypothetical protein
VAITHYSIKKIGNLNNRGSQQFQFSDIMFSYYIKESTLLQYFLGRKKNHILEHGRTNQLL